MKGTQAVLPPQGHVYEVLEQKAAAELGEGEAEAAPSGWLRFEDWVVGSLAIGALLLCSYNVVVRYFHPAWTLELVDEVQVYVIIWAVFLALGGVTAADRHVKADLFVSFFPPVMRKFAEVFVEVLGLAFALLLVWYGVILAYQAWSFGDVSTTSLRFPMWIYVAALPAGGFAMAIGYLLRLKRHVSERAAR